MLNAEGVEGGGGESESIVSNIRTVNNTFTLYTKTRIGSKPCLLPILVNVFGENVLFLLPSIIYVYGGYVLFLLPFLVYVYGGNVWLIVLMLLILHWFLTVTCSCGPCHFMLLFTC